MPLILRVLVVEDEELTRQAIAIGLRSQGFEVGEAADAAACFRRLEAEAYDVVLLDLGLPDTDGGRLAFELRGRARLGLIVVTRRAEIEARIEALDVGADDYLTKPVHPAELAARIRSVVRRRGELPPKQIQLEPWLVDLEARTVQAGAVEDSASFVSSATLRSNGTGTQAAPRTRRPSVSCRRPAGMAAARSHRKSPENAMCSQPTGEVWARRSSGAGSPAARR